jgi:pimeloyl-ACP methyl ester carboxylesterase
MANWTVALVGALGIPRVALVGHSMGALIALAASARAPDSVFALSIVGAAVPMLVSDALLAATAANDYSAIDMITTWAHSTPALLGGYSVPGIWQTGNARRLLERAAPGVLHSDFRACHSYLDGLSDAAATRCPALVVCGGRDLMTPPKAAQPLISALPDSRAVTIAEAGHMVMTEQPEKTLDVLRAFLRPLVAAAGW